MATRYWGGDPGNWSDDDGGGGDNSKWFSDAARTAPAAMPTSTDDVIFDNHASCGNCTLDEDGSCRTISWYDGYTGTFHINPYKLLKVYAPLVGTRVAVYVGSDVTLSFGGGPCLEILLQAAGMARMQLNQTVGFPNFTIMKDGVAAEQTLEFYSTHGHELTIGLLSLNPGGTSGTLKLKLSGVNGLRVTTRYTLYSGVSPQLGDGWWQFECDFDYNDFEYYGECSLYLGIDSSISVTLPSGDNTLAKKNFICNESNHDIAVSLGGASMLYSIDSVYSCLHFYTKSGSTGQLTATFADDIISAQSDKTKGLAQFVAKSSGGKVKLDLGSNNTFEVCISIQLHQLDAADELIGNSTTKFLLRSRDNAYSDLDFYPPPSEVPVPVKVEFQLGTGYDAVCRMGFPDVSARFNEEVHFNAAGSSHWMIAGLKGTNRFYAPFKCTGNSSEKLRFQPRGGVSPEFHSHCYFSKVKPWHYGADPIELVFKTVRGDGSWAWGQYQYCKFTEVDTSSESFDKITVEEPPTGSGPSYFRWKCDSFHVHIKDLEFKTTTADLLVQMHGGTEASQTNPRWAAETLTVTGAGDVCDPAVDDHRVCFAPVNLGTISPYWFIALKNQATPSYAKFRGCDASATTGRFTKTWTDYAVDATDGTSLDGGNNVSVEIVEETIVMDVSPAAISETAIEGVTPYTPWKRFIRISNAGTVVNCEMDKATGESSEPWFTVYTYKNVNGHWAEIRFRHSEAASLPPGVHTGTATLAATNAENSPIVVPVTLTVLPAFAITPEKVTFTLGSDWEPEPVSTAVVKVDVPDWTQYSGDPRPRDIAAPVVVTGAPAWLDVTVDATDPDHQIIYLELLRKPTGAESWQATLQITGSTTLELPVAITPGAFTPRAGCEMDYVPKIEGTLIEECEVPAPPPHVPYLGEVPLPLPAPSHSYPMSGSADGACMTCEFEIEYEDQDEVGYNKPKLIIDCPTHGCLDGGKEAGWYDGAGAEPDGFEDQTYFICAIELDECGHVCDLKFWEPGSS